MTSVSLFIPCYNEGEIIGRNIPYILNYLRKLPWDFEVFVVNDNSTDHSLEIAKSLKKENKNLRILTYHCGPSRRENLAHAFKKSKADIVMFMDMDLATDLKYLKPLIENVLVGNDLVTGSRHVQGAQSHRLLSRRIISHGYKYFIKMFFNSKINDHECGFKAFERKKLFNLLNHLGYDSTFKRKMVWDTEMFLIAQKLDYKIKEIPITWNEGAKSALRFSSELSIIPYLFKLKSKLRKIRK
jgi:glycosyltransferase AglD